MTHYQCSNCDISGKTSDEVKKNGCNCGGNHLFFLDPEDHKEEQSQKRDARNEKKKLYDHALGKIKRLVISESNKDEVVAVVKKEDKIETFQVHSRRFVDWLSNEYLNHINLDEIKNVEFFKCIADAIYSHAQTNGAKVTKIHTRVAQLKDEIWYDVANPDGTVIKITSSSIKNIHLDLKSPIFRKNQSLQAQVLPKYDDEKALDKLADLLKISQKDKLVFKVNLIALFLEAYPIPLIVIGGPTGCFKTTTTSFIKRIVDPTGSQKEDNVSNIPQKIDDLILHLYNRYLVSLDNVSNISKEQSDVFCRAITGNTNSKRKLYTNEDESILSFTRKIVLNGIVPYLDYPDLQTRLLIYERESADDKNRLTEEELNEKFEKLLPNVLGHIFSILKGALFWHKSLKNEIKPQTRMSDFEVYGETIARVMGANDNDFLNAYYNKLDEASISSQDSYPLVTVLEYFMKEQDTYEGSAAELYKSLVNIANNLEIDIHSNYVRFPGASNKLKKSFKEIDSMLKTNGLKVSSFPWTLNDPKYTKHATIFKITKQNSQMKLTDLASLPSPSSPQENQAQNHDNNGEHVGEDKTSLTDKIEDSRYKKQASEHSEYSEDRSID